MRINQQSFKLFNYMMLKHKTTHNYELSRLDCDTDSTRETLKFEF